MRETVALLSRSDRSQAVQSAAAMVFFCQRADRNTAAFPATIS
jgi:hypothetical protein